MPNTIGSRNRAITSTVIVLLIGAAVIGWEVLRGRGEGGAAMVMAPKGIPTRLNADLISEVARDPRVQALVPLAPSIQVQRLGNPTPFPVPEERDR